MRSGRKYLVHEGGAGRRVAFHRRARNRHERHHEGIDAERYEMLAGGEDGVLGIAEAGQDIGRYLAAPNTGTAAAKAAK